MPGSGGLLGGSAGSGVDPSLATSNNESCDQLQNAAAVSTNTEGSSSQQLEKDDGQKSEVTNTEKALVVSSFDKSLQFDMFCLWTYQDFVSNELSAFVVSTFDKSL